jgi:hypothetical protein
MILAPQRAERHTLNLVADRNFRHVSPSIISSFADPSPRLVGDAADILRVVISSAVKSQWPRSAMGAAGDAYRHV